MSGLYRTVREKTGAKNYPTKIDLLSQLNPILYLKNKTIKIFKKSFKTIFEVKIENYAKKTAYGGLPYKTDSDGDGGSPPSSPLAAHLSSSPSCCRNPLLSFSLFFFSFFLRFFLFSSFFLSFSFLFLSSNFFC